MSRSASAVASRRFMLGVLAALPTVTTLFGAATAQAQTTPVASWSDGPAKQAILDFVKLITDRTSTNYVPPGERIATFDQDGTLWMEHPLYVQAFFALDRVHEMAPRHPEWKSREPFKAVLTNDLSARAHLSERNWAELILVTHAGMSQAEFLDIVAQWLATAKHPRFKRPFTELVYQPMIEILEYLRANQFEIGSSLVTKYEFKDGKAELMRLPKLFINDNFDGKAIGNDLFIGKRPYAAFGNSTGDREMLERLKMLVYHDDAAREYAYGPAGDLPERDARFLGWRPIP